MAENEQRLSPEETLYPDQTVTKEPGKQTGGAERHLSMEETLYPDTVADQAAEGDDQPKADDPQSVAAGPPEAYQLTPPEGLEITPDILAEAAPVFKEIGLSNDQANKLMPLAGQFAERLMDAQVDAFSQLKKEWVQEAKADPQIGGTRWRETEHLIATALDAAGAPRGSKFRQLLDETGLGNHPEMIRVFRTLGQRLRSAKAGASTKKLSREELWYGRGR